MYPAYFDTRFRIDSMPEEWPTQFVILSAWATTGYSPITGHAEPNWAFPMTLSEACDLGQQFLQDALYYVEGDQLSVTHCDHRRSPVPVGSFRQRLDVMQQ